MSRRTVKKKRNKLSMFLIGFAVMVLCSVLLVQISDMRETQRQLKTQEASLQARYDEEMNRTKQLEEERVYVQTKKYVEEKAKEFGYVYPDEIILKPEK